MKKVFLTTLFLFLLVRLMADEGMWLPYLLGEQVYADIVKKGIKLSKEQLYSVNKNSIKDAIVVFSNGYTGELIGSDGLGCSSYSFAFDALARNINSDLNLAEGLFTKTRKEELSLKGVYAEFLVKVEDVSGEILSAIKDAGEMDRPSKLAAIKGQIEKRLSDPTKNTIARISSFWKDNQFIAFTYQRYSDIRLVAIPPQSLGRFGGASAKGNWPGYAAAFSLFRIYVSKENISNGYSAENVPLKSKYVLPVSTKGVKENDPTVVIGYPASSDRYEPSFDTKLKIEVEDPSLVKLLDTRLKLMTTEMKKDASLKNQITQDYNATSEALKKYESEQRGFAKNAVADLKKNREDVFQKWAQGKPDYQGVLADWSKNYDGWRPYAKHDIYLRYAILGSRVAAFAASLQSVETALVKLNGGDIKKVLAAATEARQQFLKTENKVSDQNFLAAGLMYFYADIDKRQHPISFFEGIKGSFGDLKDENTYKKYAAAIFGGTMFFDDAKWNDFITRPDATVLQEDPAYNFTMVFVRNWTGKFAPIQRQFEKVNNISASTYSKGILEMNLKNSYPDANGTMRLSYGNIKSWSPEAAVHFDYAGSLKGMLEKYVPGDADYDLPENFVTLAKKKDFAPYADKVRNDLVVAFTINNDFTTNGSDGSGVINANGELTGIVVDGNIESLYAPYYFNTQQSRLVCVDIRFVLWCIDKLGATPAIISELKISK